MGSQSTGIDDLSSTDSTPEDVAALYAWANLSGAKYRDYSASRREHRARVRYKAAKALLERELKAQSDAEAAAQAAEAEAAAAEARALSGTAGEPQQARLAALRAAEAATLRAAAERVEAARRTEAAAHATMLAVRVERELAAARASARQQETIYAEADALRKQLAGPQPQLSLGAELPDGPGARRDERSAPEVEAVVTTAPSPLDKAPVAPRTGSWQPLSKDIVTEAVGGFQRPRSAEAQDTREKPAEQPRPAWLAVSPVESEADASAPGVSLPEPSVHTEVNASHPSAEPETHTEAAPSPSAATEAENLPPRWVALQHAFQDLASRDDLIPQQAPEVATPLLAVFSIAGGAGATSISAAVARALSAASEKVVLIDTTSQALLPFYFGGKALVPGLMRTYSPPDERCEPVTLFLHDATQTGGDAARQEQLAAAILNDARNAERLVVDVSPASGWILRRWARLRPAVLVPLIPTMDAVLRLDATERLFRGIRVTDSDSLLPFYVLNRFDASLPLHVDVQQVLRRRLGDRLLPFTIREAPTVAEAAADGLTVLDYAPSADVAQEYVALAAWLRSVSPPRPLADLPQPRGSA